MFLNKKKPFHIVGTYLCMVVTNCRTTERPKKTTNTVIGRNGTELLKFLFPHFIGSTNGQHLIFIYSNKIIPTSVQEIQLGVRAIKLGQNNKILTL